QVVTEPPAEDESDSADGDGKRTRGRKRTKAPARRSKSRNSAAAKGRATVHDGRAGRKAELPKSYELQLASLSDGPPEGDRWLHEIKFDGYRLLCRLSRGRARFITRGRQDWTDRFPGLSKAAAGLDVKSAVLDGEAVALLPNGVSSFQTLQNAFRGESAAPIVYYAFDLLYLDGRDLRTMPLEERKERLAALLKDVDPEGALRYSEHISGQGPEFFRQACERGLEGMISTRRDRPYQGGRGVDWIKTKCVQHAEFVIGGFTEPAGSRAGFGSLLLGYHDNGGALVYAGRVGTGFNARVLHDLRRRLDALEQRRSPFKDAARRSIRAHWVSPQLVAQVEFANWTNDGLLRQPSFQGLREDKAAVEVTREVPMKDAFENPQKRDRAQPAPARASRVKTKSTDRNSASGESAEIAGVTLTHPERVLYPEQGISKFDLATYYLRVADWILPHLAGRPLSLVRCPSGRQKACFFQKHLGAEASQAVGRVEIEEKHKTADYAVIEDIAGLVSLVQLGTLEFHPWGARADNVERPDRIVFDLDPGPDVEWEQVIDGARRVRAALLQYELTSFVKTTGGKGLHVVLPIQRRNDWEEVYPFAKAIARRVADEAPETFLIQSSRSLRQGKIFIDYLRNQRGATAVAPYSTRARAGAPISVPLAWEQLSEDLRSDRFRVNDLPDWLSSRRRDPWKGMHDVRQSITKSIGKDLGIA
ncbi:MAG TPA: DNA ligase D, partial [Pirellulales bacterium]|nr:DNA ligase D [Pirellulales bacterium]